MATKKKAALRKFSYYFDGDSIYSGGYDGGGVIEATDHNHALVKWMVKTGFQKAPQVDMDIFELTDVETGQMWTAEDFSTPKGSARFYADLSRIDEEDDVDDESMLKEGSFVKNEGIYYFPEGEPKDWVKGTKKKKAILPPEKVYDTNKTDLSLAIRHQRVSLLFSGPEEKTSPGFRMSSSPCTFRCRRGCQCEQILTHLLSHK